MPEKNVSTTAIIFAKDFCIQTTSEQQPLYILPAQFTLVFPICLSETWMNNKNVFIYLFI